MSTILTYAGDKKIATLTGSLKYDAKYWTIAAEIIVFEESLVILNQFQIRNCFAHWDVFFSSDQQDNPVKVL